MLLRFGPKCHNFPSSRCITGSTSSVVATLLNRYLHFITVNGRSGYYSDSQKSN